MAIEYHEPPGELQPHTRDLHRAISSLTEEFEAIDWYQHRMDVCGDEELCALLEHNRNEEMEHAAMALEWLRRRIPELDERLRKYLFTEGSIVVEERAEDNGRASSAEGLGLRSLKDDGA